MITTEKINLTVTPIETISSSGMLELSRLLAGAVVNRSFRQLLLSDPVQAIKNGYRDESFHFTESEMRTLSSFRAGTLQEFARQVIAACGSSTISPSGVMAGVPVTIGI